MYILDAGEGGHVRRVGEGDVGELPRVHGLARQSAGQLQAVVGELVPGLLAEEAAVVVVDVVLLQPRVEPSCTGFTIISATFLSTHRKTSMTCQLHMTCSY